MKTTTINFNARLSAGFYFTFFSQLIVSFLLDLLIKFKCFLIF